MTKNTRWEKDIGRRLRLRDLHTFFAVVERGSMAKAAADLGVSQPSVSELIAGLEHAVGARLLDRSPQGVEPTAYGRALLNRGQAAFDELRQGMRDIEFLSNPAAGEVRLGCSEMIASTLLPQIIDGLSRKHPRVSFKVAHITANPPDLRGLQERTLDLVMGALPRTGRTLPDDCKSEILMTDTIRLVVGAQSRWAGHRKIDLAELVDEPWIMTPPETPLAYYVAAAFRARGLEIPKVVLDTYSIHLRNHLLATGRFVAPMATSVLQLNAGPFGLKVLPIDLPGAEIPVAVMTMRNQILTPVVELFLECARSIAKSISEPKSAAEARVVRRPN